MYCIAFAGVESGATWDCKSSFRQLMKEHGLVELRHDISGSQDTDRAGGGRLNGSGVSFCLLASFRWLFNYERQQF